MSVVSKTGGENVRGGSVQGEMSDIRMTVRRFVQSTSSVSRTQRPDVEMRRTTISYKYLSSRRWTRATRCLTRIVLYT